MKANASTPCQNIATVGFLFVLGLLALVSIAATNDPKVATPELGDAATMVGVLASSTTIRVSAMHYKLNKMHCLAPDAQLTVTFARPDMYRVEIIDCIGNSSLREEPDLFVTDGSEASEYLSETNQYRTFDIAGDRPLRLSALTNADHKAMTEALSDGFQKTFTPRVGDAVMVKVTQIEGEPARLIDLRIPHLRNPNQIISSRRLWCSLNSGLPIRYERYYRVSGKETIYERINYSKWKINQPISRSTFVWKAPRTASPYQYR